VDEFGWTPKTALDEGVAAAIQYYRDHGITETYTHLRGLEPDKQPAQ
jgi:UDP-glucose 4-epimerase